MRYPLSNEVQNPLREFGIPSMRDTLSFICRLNCTCAQYHAEQFSTMFQIEFVAAFFVAII